MYMQIDFHLVNLCPIYFKLIYNIVPNYIFDEEEYCLQIRNAVTGRLSFNGFSSILVEGVKIKLIFLSFPLYNFIKQ